MRGALYLACLALAGLVLGALILDPARVPMSCSALGAVAALLAGGLDPSRPSPWWHHAPSDATVASGDSLAPVALRAAPVNRRRPR
jgi:hypothetical protein